MSGLPPGFVLDQQPNAGLPEGFVIDSQPGLLSRIGSDIGPEIKGAFNENLDAIKGMYGGTAEKGVLQQTMDVGKGLLAIPGIIASPITGAARAIGGHTLAAAEQAAGSVINPQAVAKENYQDVYQQAKGGVDQAMMAAAPRGASPVGLRQVPAKPPAAAELKQAARDVWNSPEIKGKRIDPAEVSNLSASIENDLIQKGFRPTADSAPGTFAELGRMTPKPPKGPSQAERLQAEMNWQQVPEAPRVQAVVVDDIRAARRALNEKAKQVGPDFTPTSEAVAARSAIERIDEFLDNVDPRLRQANADYAAGKRAETLDYRTIKADRNAAKSGSGSNMENTMRQAVDKIGDRGLSKPEIAARDRIVLGSTGRNALRKIGKLGVGDGLSLMLHTAAAGATGGSSIPLAAAGTLARKVGEALTRAEIAALNRSIRTRSPLAKALASKPQFAKIPKGAKAIAAALLTQGSQRPAFAGILPAYADEDKR
jgi:hypothetical protein